MEKSMYSVILRDDLVAELDRLAFQNGVSRSAMLNKILSDYLDVETPESKMEKMLLRFGEAINAVNGLRFTNNASLATAQVQSALTYRYNPTLRYQVELFYAGDLGQLKVSLRSQNKQLFKLMESFYVTWIAIEEKYIGKRTYFYEDGRFVRVFVRPNSVDAEAIGEAISDYVTTFDRCLKTYVSDETPFTKEKIEQGYVLNIYNKKVIL